MRARCGLMAVLLVGAWAVSASGLTIKLVDPNGVNPDVVVFSDDLEGYSGFRPDPCEPPWVVVYEDDWTQPDEGTVWVETADYPPDPPAAQGSGYMTVKRVDTGHGWDVAGQVVADLGAHQSEGVLRAEFSLNPRSYGEGNNAVIPWLPSPFVKDQTPWHSALLVSESGVKYLGPGGWQPTGLSVEDGQWNVFVYELNLQTNTSSVMVNGEWFHGMAAANPSLEVGGLKYYGGGNGAEFGVDAWPLPTNCAEARALGYVIVGDLDDNCHVNLNDLGLMAGNWLVCQDPCDVDCDHPWEF